MEATAAYHEIDMNSSNPSDWLSQEATSSLGSYRYELSCQTHQKRRCLNDPDLNLILTIIRVKFLQHN
jgi:hypothetical protein